jgi:hypothetical protein
MLTWNPPPQLSISRNKTPWEHFPQMLYVANYRTEKKIKTRLLRFPRDSLTTSGLMQRSRTGYGAGRQAAGGQASHIGELPKLSVANVTLTASTS